MTRISVHVPDPVAEGLRAMAGETGSMSAAAATLLEQALAARVHAAVGVYEARHDDPRWEAQRLTNGIA